MGIPGSVAGVTREDIREVFSLANEPATPPATDEVATRRDCPTETARRNLKKLVGLDRARRKQRDASTHIWRQRDESVSPGQQPKSAEYSAFVSAVKDSAIFTLDPDGTVVSWNDGAKRRNGDDEAEIGAERNGSMWEVSGHDKGIGIDSEEGDRIFEGFQRLHSQEDNSGTGIGLALCRRIIERHGGEIWAESNPGEGSTFSFTLPRTGEADE